MRHNLLTQEAAVEFGPALFSELLLGGLDTLATNLLFHASQIDRGIRIEIPSLNGSTLPPSPGCLLLCRGSLGCIFGSCLLRASFLILAPGRLPSGSRARLTAGSHRCHAMKLIEKLCVILHHLLGKLLHLIVLGS